MATALASLLEFGKEHNKFKLSEINLDDNGMKDESFCQILTAIENTLDLKILNYNNNGLGQKSVAAISKIL